jgi:Resolvase, N terminal domain
VLVIARLDRLARNVAFIANPMNSDVEFVAVDMPHANRPTIHILAAVAEHERELISQRMAVDSAQLADGKPLLSYMKDVHSVARLVSLERQGGGGDRDAGDRDGGVVGRAAAGH